jgi:hypothetical protein
MRTEASQKEIADEVYRLKQTLVVDIKAQRFSGGVEIGAIDEEGDPLCRMKIHQVVQKTGIPFKACHLDTLSRREIQALRMMY